MANVSFKKLEKTYPNGFKAVHGIDLDIREGEFMVFVGPSGCAKSTILRMVAGLESITGGEVRIGDKVVNQLTPKERGIAMVFQNYALYPHMTVRDNLGFGLKLSGIKGKQLEHRVNEAAELLEITPLLARYPKQLSGGQAQRVAVGRAIVKKPDVFLFDEPLSNLDAKLRASMRVRITELHRKLKESNESSTVIYVTHDQVEAMTMGDRICVLKEGVIQQVDTPTRLYENPVNTFVASFIGSPEMNLIDAVFKSDAGQISLDIYGFNLPLPLSIITRLNGVLASNEQVTVGIRPEYFFYDVADARAGATWIDCRLRFMENMGNEIFFHFELGGQLMSARIASDRASAVSSLGPGQVARLGIHMDKVNIFSKATGLNLLS